MNLLATLFVLLCTDAFAQDMHYQIWCLGKGCGRDISTITTPGTALMGGGVILPYYENYSVFIMSVHVFALI